MTKDGLLESMPFAAGILLIVVQPLFDKAWHGNFSKTFDVENLPVDVVGGADWVANVSAFLPNALLTTFGALYLSVQHEDRHSGLIFWSACLVPLVSFVLYMYQAFNSKPGKSPFICGLYGMLQIWLFFLNGLGIWLAFHYN